MKQQGFLDAWQAVPVLWDAIRYTVDMRGELLGQFILTGSAVARDNVVEHPGTDRISRMTIRPMSLFESKESNGAVSLPDSFIGETEIDVISDLGIEEISKAIVRGG